MDDDRQVLRTEAGTKLSREQKAGFVFVIVCGLSALVLGGQYLWTHMAAPFAIHYTGPHLLLGSEEEAAQIAEAKKADSDYDTVSDYDELYIYKTSPYLEDSDSDGLTDGAEIAAGQDPNCALGAACAAASNEDVDLSGNAAALEAQGAELEARQQALDQALTELSNIPVPEIRDMLVQSGADQAQIDALTDDEVKTLYQNILQQLQAQGATDSLVAPSTETSP